MTNILVIDEHPKTKKLLLKCLETAGFSIVSTEKGLVTVHLVNENDEKLSTITKNEQLNSSDSIFPAIPRLIEVF